MPDGAAGFEYTVIAALRETRDGKEFLMVRHVERGWELPGGKIEPGEGPVHCALREFREETGHLLGHPRFVTKIHKPNGLCYVFTGILGQAVEAGAKSGDAVREMRWFHRLPSENLAFPDDPYEEMGRLLGISFR
ncbi:MAG TPA: NUDIX domain-containing protein [Candidatus Thermoplasmatota archaeon]|nr:NUDIX domain-containing protein [Candidatus Thermoplasmatota archaeon]